LNSLTSAATDGVSGNLPPAEDSAASPEIHGGLQRLADLAVRTGTAGAIAAAVDEVLDDAPPVQQLPSAGEGRKGDDDVEFVGFDPSAVIRRGYLGGFDEERL